MRRFFLLILLLGVFASPVWAANAVYLRLGTGIVWTDTGGDEQLDLGDGALGVAGAVGCGSYHDWGATPQPRLYYVEVVIDGFTTAPVVGQAAHVYVSQGQTTSFFTGTITLNDTADVASSTVVLPNLLQVGSLVVQTTTAADNVQGAFWAQVPSRYWAPCVHNATANNFLTTSDAHTVTVYPAYWEVQ